MLHPKGIGKQVLPLNALFPLLRMKLIFRYPAFIGTLRNSFFSASETGQTLKELI